MGFLSVALVRHDALHRTKEDVELGKKLHDAVVGFDRRHASHNVSDGVELVAANIHASNFGTVVVEGNTAYHIEEALASGGSLPEWSKAEGHLVELVKRLGYKVVRPRNKKK